MTSQASETRNNKSQKVTVDNLSAILIDIVKLYPRYAMEVKVNMFLRKYSSVIAGHDTSIINCNYDKLNHLGLNFKLLIIALLYFMAEKLSLENVMRHLSRILKW